MEEEILVRRQRTTETRIQYKLIRNGYLSRKAKRNIYVASVLPTETCGTLQIAERMVSEGCAVKKSTIVLVINEFAELIGKLVGEGRSINIGGVVRFMPVIHGTFDSLTEAWNPEKHTVEIKACVGKNMRIAAAKSPVKRVR